MAKRNLVHQNSFQGDLCWPDVKMIFEYNGRDSHPDEERDLQRKADLEELGWTVRFIDRYTLRSQAKTDALAEELARSTKHRIRKPQGWQERNWHLKQELSI